MANGDGTKSSPRVLERLRNLPKNHPTRVKARARTRAWLTANPERVRRHRLKRKRVRRAWENANPALAVHARRARVLRKYGLSPEQWDEIFALQNSACAICKSTTSGDGRWHTDHDDAIGHHAVRGILCVRCNIGIGQFEHEPSRLDAARDYLLKWKSSRVPGVSGI